MQTALQTQFQGRWPPLVHSCVPPPSRCSGPVPRPRIESGLLTMSHPRAKTLLFSQGSLGSAYPSCSVMAGLIWGFSLTSLSYVLSLTILSCPLSLLSVPSAPYLQCCYLEWLSGPAQWPLGKQQPLGVDG
jgi:hypothetical protein